MVFCPVITRTWPANPVAVNPLNEAARARTAANALRIPGPVQVDATDSSRADLRWRGQLVEGLVGGEADVDALQRCAEPSGHAGQSREDLTEHVDPEAAVQFFGVAHDRLEPQHSCRRT